MDKILDLVTDPYERKARATPALLTLLPVLVPLVCQFGSKNPILTAIVGLFGTCGAIYAGASIARGRGKLLETELVEEWGGLPTTIILLFKDNIAYGFHRNMLGMKPIGVLASIVGMIYGLILAGAIALDPPSINVHSLASPGLRGGLSFLVGFGMLLTWLWYFNRRQVRVIGTAYAERLFEKLPGQKKLPGSGKSPAPPTA